MKKNYTLVLLLAVGIISTYELKAQIPGNGFEDWADSTTYMEPVGWTTTNQVSTGSFYAITRSTDAYPPGFGNYSIRLENDTAAPSYDGIGFAWTNQITDMSSGPAFPITGHPNSLTGYYKFISDNGDSMIVHCELFLNGSYVANAKLLITATTNTWTSFNVPFSSYTSADSATIMIASYGASSPTAIPLGNSVAFIDNLNFDVLIGGGTGLETSTDVNWKVFPNPAYDFINIQTSESGYAGSVQILTMAGRVVQQSYINLPAKVIWNWDISSLPAGNYLIRMGNRTKLVTKVN